MTSIAMRTRHTPLPVVASLLSFAAASGVAIAAPINIGTINLDTYEAYVDDDGGDPGMFLGGVLIEASYMANDAFADQDCCTLDDLEWIQVVNSNKPTGFTPDPNRPFIDPRMGQGIGGGNVGDGNPWYNQGTEGPDFYDRPGVFQNRATADMPYMFSATLALVCKNDTDKTMAILGGFTWGFTTTLNNGMYSVAAKPTGAIGDTMAVRTLFNTALDNDFADWNMIAGTEAWDDMEFTFTFVPTPGTMFIAAAGLCAIARRRRAA